MRMPEPESAPPPHNGTFLPPPKQIRFVSTDGQPHAKRRRINAACLTCRRRKTRCSGERPQCKTCTDNGHICVGYAGKSMSRAKIGSSEEDESATELSPTRVKSHTLDKDLARPVPPRSDPSYSHSSYQGLRGNSDATELKSPDSSHTFTSGATAARTRVPFFRYFGPTAIVPGFKQMVVQLKDRDHRASIHSASHESPASLHRTNSIGQESTPQDLAFYDPTDPSPVPPLIVHLCELFFDTLGCNYPFLQRDRLMNDLQEKRVEAILVDAICAVAARFSTHAALSKAIDTSLPVDEDGHVKRAYRGQPYAQRAGSGLIEAFGRPTIAVAQACLLLGYEEFGTDRDSGLWMFLGTSIRMAQDLGISKLEGLMLEGRIGPTPKIVKMDPDLAKHEMHKREEQQRAAYQSLLDLGEEDTFDDRRASEHERIDTFWAILFLDRAVSIGVGRPVTLRDKDIEISFPYRPDETMINGYPHPYPVMIRIMHLNGRIADVINNIQMSSEVNSDGLQRLTAFEKDLTGIYQRMPSKLHFNATNFQHYVKANQGTNFILVHFWFHTNIILLHQPTLLQSLTPKTQQLFPDSRELSMSSAKTIADILAFAELIDTKSLFGNPFVSQPMYVAACAFLAEARVHSSKPNSRQASPPEKRDVGVENDAVRERTLNARAAAAKHSLLATAANQNYQRCYNALKVLGTYWAGTRYITTALDGKSAGLNNPTLFTEEDIDGEMPSEQQNFIQPGWRKTAPGPSPRRESVAWSPRMDWSQAIGWSLTGTTNSPAPNFSFLYSGASDENTVTESKPKVRQSRERPEVPLFHANPDSKRQPQISNPSQGASNQPLYNVSTADADLLLGLGSYSVPSGNASLSQSSQPSPSAFDFGVPQQSIAPRNVQSTHSNYYASPASETPPGFTDMLVESQEVDVANPFATDTSGNLNMNFPGGDMIWLEYLPSDVLSYFGQSNDLDGMVLPTGPGPPT